MDSKHGGSPVSGIVPPAGLGTEQPAIEGGKVLAPQVAIENRNAKDRALQFERRRLALAVLSNGSMFGPEDQVAESDVKTALLYADTLLALTGGHV